MNNSQTILLVVSAVFSVSTFVAVAVGVGFILKAIKLLADLIVISTSDGQESEKVLTELKRI